MNTNNVMNKGLVLIVDEMHLSLMPMLENLGFQTDYQPKISRVEIIEKLKNCTGLIIRSKTFVDAELLQNANQLKFIGRAGAGLDLIDIDYVERRNIALFAANEGNRVAVAEHVLGMVLCLMNNILIADKEVRNGVWQREKNRGYELMGKTVGIIGYGNNGSETAKRFRAFGCKVLAYDKYKTSFSDEFVEEASLERIFDEAEVLSLHIPLTSESSQMVNNEFLASFKHNIFFVNASRGEIVSLSALADSLDEGKVKGACLDVLENEKLQKLTLDQQVVFERLKSSERVIFTPHIAGWTFESYVKINEVLVEKIASLK
ncbi:MAG: 2-hydroxyacid dehydrogenase [Emticicia sp.]|uniref:2-hydroxyacid dehydrogenase n=1 Tax=Emticicia sp. TaxID=1930953 RepID=UPI003BA6BF25